MTGILGPNGSGKSNIFAAIIGALTNEWINAGSKDANVSYGSHGKSSVKLDFNHNGNKYQVERVLSQGNSLIKANQQLLTRVTGETEITKTILDVLGISKQMLLDYVLVRQGSISGILSQTPAVRAKSFQRLFGTARCEEIYNACLPVIQKLSIEQDYSQEASLIKEKSSLEKEIESLKFQILDFTQILPSREKIDTLHNKLAQIEKRESEIVKAITLNDSIKLLKKTLNNLSSEEKKISEEIEKLQDILNSSEKSAQSAQINLSRIKEFDIAWKKRLSLESDKNKIQEEIYRLKRDEPHAPSEKKPDQSFLIELRSEYATHKKLVDAINPTTGAGICPVCRTPGTQLKERAKESFERMQEIESQGKAITKLISSWEDFEQNSNEFLSQITNLSSQLHSLDSALSTISIPEKPEEGEWDKEVETFRDNKHALEFYQDKLSNTKQAISENSGRLSSTSESLESIERFIEETNPLKDISKQEIKDIIVNAEDIRVKISGMDGTLKASSAHARQLEKQIASIRSEREKNKKRVSFSKTLTNVRQVFHRDGIPATVSRRYLHALTDESSSKSSINYLLGVFNSPFRVEVREEDLSFIANFDDGKSQPAERLSGGEKVILSLAIRIAINALFASHLSMLFLDEPTEYLDEANLECLHTAIQNLGELAEASGMQVIIITHEQTLSPLFDHIINL